MSFHTRNSCFRFSVRTLLVFILILSVALAWVARLVNHAGIRREAITGIRRSGGFVSYYCGAQHFHIRRPGPKWLRRLVGEEWLAKPKGVQFTDQIITDLDLDYIESLADLELLWLIRCSVSDAQVERLGKMTHLKHIDLHHTVSGANANKLQQQLPNYRSEYPTPGSGSP